MIGVGFERQIPVRMRRGGERDTRGDSNWVPAEAVERIEVLRGPAAARYGSGASGGVVNIITRRPEKFTFSATSFANIPESDKEGRTYRSTIVAGGPIDERFSYRITANYNRTDADDIDINEAATPFIPVTDWYGNPVLGPDGQPQMQRDAVAAGKEGVVNTDFRGLLSWKLDERHVVDFEAAWSQQRNIYAGDMLFSDVSVSDLNQELTRGDRETNRVTRTTLSATHRGKWDFGTSNTYIQWENSVNRRLGEGNVGRVEGQISSRYARDRKDITLDNLTAKSEWNFPLTIVVPQTLTAGAEFRGEWMDDETMRDGNGMAACLGLQHVREQAGGLHDHFLVLPPRGGYPARDTVDRPGIARKGGRIAIPRRGLIFPRDLPRSDIPGSLMLETGRLAREDGHQQFVLRPEIISDGPLADIRSLGNQLERQLMAAVPVDDLFGGIQNRVSPNDPFAPHVPPRQKPKQQCGTTTRDEYHAQWLLRSAISCQSRPPEYPHPQESR
jgi:hypothetical protein